MSQSKDKGGKIAKPRFEAIFLGLVAGTVLFALSLAGAKLWMDRALIEARFSVLTELGLLRSQMEAAVTSRFQQVYGIAAYIRVFPDLDRASFDRYARNLFEDDPVVKHVSILKGTTIVFAYPHEGNEAAIGRDLSLVCDQAETVQKAIDTRKPVIAGPVDLVQGGVGIVSRVPIFLAPYDDGAWQGPYWGQASVVLILDSLLESAGFIDNRFGLELALRGKDGKGELGEPFWGRKGLFEEESVLLDIDLPGGSWQIAAAPTKGWPGLFSMAWPVIIAGLAFSCLVGILLALLSFTRSELKDMAFHDVLTGLPNRVFLYDRLAQEIKHARRDHTGLAVAMIDLDGFKAINDRYGHPAGDRVLQDSARRLQETVRASDTVARFGGDEFVIILSGIDSRDSAAALKAKISGAFSKPFSFAGLADPLAVGASVGIALFPDDCSDAADIIKLADEHMYRAKEAR